jgi:hypothetical protein
LAVSFSSAGSSDPENAALTYIWDFGDGTGSTSANPSKTYTVSGQYVAQLRVSDGTNTSVPSTVNISVGNSAAGLVAAYGFEEGSGSVTADISGNGNQGSISGATWSSSGHFGKALSFGPNALVSINNSASIDLTSGMTVEAWVYPTSVNGWMNVVYKSGSSAVSYVLQGSTSPSNLASLGGSFSASNLSASSPLPVNTWSHLAGTYDGTSMNLYLNGLLVASRPQTGAIDSSAGTLSIGGNPVYGENWTGLIDEVRIYNRALSQSEIHADINIPLVGPSSRPSSPPTAPHVVGP